MSILYYDVATTRFHTDKQTGEKPAVIRIAWWMDGEPSPSCSLVTHDAITMDARAQSFHGITMDDLAKADDEAAWDAVEEFSDAIGRADELVAFNAEFHERNANHLLVAIIQVLGTRCAMKAATPIVKKPRMAPGGGYAFPTLVEACNFFHVPLPLAPGDDGGSDPIARGKSIVRAVREVWEAMHPAC